MKLFDLLAALGRITASSCKIHLACHNGIEDPLDVFYAGDFKKWQEGQNKKNFERDYVLGLIQMPQRAQWLFAGVYRTAGCVPDPNRPGVIYSTFEQSEYSEFIGRLIVKFERPGRQSYLLAENWVDSIIVTEIKSERLSVSDFPGYKALSVKKSHLDIIVRDMLPTWRAALSSVSGVYVICDTLSGKLYVGSAYGDGGIWARWTNYSLTGHGGNAGLKELLSQRGSDYARSFLFGILEVCDSSASREDVLSRESHWKKLLCTQSFGYNQN